MHYHIECFHVEIVSDDPRFYALSVEEVCMGGYRSAETSVTTVPAIRKSGAVEASVARSSNFSHSFNGASSVMDERSERWEVFVASISSLVNSRRHYFDVAGER